MRHPSQLGCKSCQKAYARFRALEDTAAVTEEKALAAYTFGTSCRAHDGGSCASGVMLADDAYAWLYAQVSMA